MNRALGGLRVEGAHRSALPPCTSSDYSCRLLNVRSTLFRTPFHPLQHYGKLKKNARNALRHPPFLPSQYRSSSSSSISRSTAARQSSTSQSTQQPQQQPSL